MQSENCSHMLYDEEYIDRDTEHESKSQTGPRSTFDIDSYVLIKPYTNESV